MHPKLLLGRILRNHNGTFLRERLAIFLGIGALVSSAPDTKGFGGWHCLDPASLVMHAAISAQNESVQVHLGDHMDLGGGWVWAEWIGYVHVGYHPWVYVVNKGWFYFVGPSADNLWAYHYPNGWLWTNNVFFPLVYHVTSEAFLNFDDIGGHLGESQPPPHVIDYVSLQPPVPGDHTLHILSPAMLELVLIDTKEPSPGRVQYWDWVDDDFAFSAPDLSRITVTIDDVPVDVDAVGFKRRPLFAPLHSFEPRIASHLYLQLTDPVQEGATVVVRNDGSLWPQWMEFAAEAHPLRYSPAIHVNQEGYMPQLPKFATVGYYIGDLGELNVPVGQGFRLIDAATGKTAYTGELIHRPDTGYTYSPQPYQKVYEADFSDFSPSAESGEYYLVVPGMGASLPFLIDDGVGMAIARTYGLGLYHQRSGTPIEMPYTRFTHSGAHLEPVQVPISDAEPFTRTWELIADNAMQSSAADPPQQAPVLSSPDQQLYPFINTGPIDVSGGYFEAANYSKLTWNSTQIIHTLTFAVDVFSGVAELDNLGIPESGDGISDVLQAAKWEADFIAKMQDADGAFYYAVHPIDRLYESNVMPDEADPQVVWPKNTSVTAASVAALAQLGSSPAMQTAYPESAAMYLAKAEMGWDFLMSAIAEHGRAGAYQALMHFGNTFQHDDELVWAAAEMYIATGDAAYRDTLMEWYPDPGDTTTFRWEWWRLFGSYGNAIRSIVGAVKNGRVTVEQIGIDYYEKCLQVLLDHGKATLAWSDSNAYGTSFPDETKRVQGAGWYFSSVQAYDLVTAYQFDPDPGYLEAVLRNLNYELGVNPVNVSYITGLGWKRQREVVDQFSANDHRVLPKTGVPIGNIQQGFQWTFTYEGELTHVTFPFDGAQPGPYPYYDRWTDFWNVLTEASSTDIARALPVAAWIGAQSDSAAKLWQFTTAEITVTSTDHAAGEPVTLQLHVDDDDLDGIRIVWEAAHQEPVFGDPETLSYSFTPTENGEYWIEAEVQWPDGRRAFAKANVVVGSPSS